MNYFEATMKTLEEFVNDNRPPRHGHTYWLEESKAVHCAMLVAHMREADKLEMTDFGVSPQRGLWQCFKKSTIRRTGFVDGKIALMGGVSGGMMAHEGEIWMLTTPAVEIIPIAFVKEARKFATQMLAIFPTLTGNVSASYTKAIRFLEMAGFTVEEAKPLGPNNAMFHRITMTRD